MSDDDTYSVVYEAPTELDCTICKQLLEEAGIPVVVRSSDGEYFRIILGQGYAGIIAKLLVPIDQVGHATLLLSDYQAKVNAGAFALKGDDDEQTNDERSDSKFGISWTLTILGVFLLMLLCRILIGLFWHR